MALAACHGLMVATGTLLVVRFTVTLAKGVACLPACLRALSAGGPFGMSVQTWGLSDELLLPVLIKAPSCLVAIGCTCIAWGKPNPVPFGSD